MQSIIMKKMLLVLMVSLFFNAFSYANQEDLIKSAENGNADAQFTLADYYLKSDEERYAGTFPLFNLNVEGKIRKDHELGFKWLNRAARNRNARAMYVLATFYDPKETHNRYSIKIEPERNIKLAMYWYLKSADLKDQSTLKMLASKYDVESDPTTGGHISCSKVVIQKMKALQYYNEAFDRAEAGNVAYSLAKIYNDGSFGWSSENKCEKNLNQAIKYYELAVLYDSYYKNEASFFLGDHLFTRHKFSDALKYYLIYLDNESVSSFSSEEKLKKYLSVQFKVAYMYENGLGSQKNISKAIMFYSKAANAGLIEAQQNLMVLRNKIGSFKPI